MKEAEASGLARIERAARAAESVRVNHGVGCWALVRLRGVNSMASKLYGLWHNCRKHARPGHLTCVTHAAREDEAQALAKKAQASR